MTNKDFYNSFLELVKAAKQDHLKVFNDALTYVLRFLSVDKVDTPWEYGPEENSAFNKFMWKYFQFVQDNTNTHFWVDAWGDMYMDLAGNYKDFRGQFFTPVGMSDLIARISRSGPSISITREVVNDCACGSARMLLAAEAQAFEHGDPQPYLIGEDIDGMCCKMAAVNLAVHGCIGEIIKHDSLGDPGGLQYGYKINETLVEGLGYPSIRMSYEKDDFYKIRETRQPVMKHEEHVQLSLF